MPAFATLEEIIKFASGAGAPSSTPLYAGQTYYDTTNHIAYIANGASSSANWIKVYPSKSLYLVGQEYNGVTISLSCASPTVSSASGWITLDPTNDAKWKMDFDILVAFATNVGEYNPVSINGVVAPAASFKANQSFTTVVDNGNAPNLARFYASDDGSYPSIFRACATAGGGSGNMRMFGGVILTTLPTWGNPT